MKVALGFFVSEYKLANLCRGELMMCASVTDLVKMGVFRSNFEKMHWDKANRGFYKGYSSSTFNDLVGRSAHPFQHPSAQL